MVQKVIVVREGKKNMAQEQRSAFRKQVEEAIDLKLEEKVVPRFDMIDSQFDKTESRFDMIESDLKEIKDRFDKNLKEINNTLKLLVPKP